MPCPGRSDRVSAFIVSNQESLRIRAKLSICAGRIYALDRTASAFECLLARQCGSEPYYSSDGGCLIISLHCTWRYWRIYGLSIPLFAKPAMIGVGVYLSNFKRSLCVWE